MDAVVDLNGLAPRVHGGLDGYPDADAGASRQALSDIAALADFLRNHPPPSHNFMSTPYDGPGEARSAWSRICKMSWRSKAPLSQKHGETQPSPLLRPRPPCLGHQVLLPSQWIKQSHARGHNHSVSLGGKPHDYIGVLPTSLDSSLLNDTSAPWNQADVVASPKSCLPPPQASLLPVRTSSMMASRDTNDPAFIDSLISQQYRWRHAIYRPQELGCDTSDGVSRTSSRRGTMSEWGAASRPGLVADLGGERPAMAQRKGRKGSGLTVIVDSPIVSHRDGSPPALPRPESSKSRKDIVRDRKRRDMEALRTSKQAQCTPSVTRQGEQNVQRPSKDQATEGPAGPLALSGIMVVADLRPRPGPERAGSHSASAKTTTAAAAAGTEETPPQKCTLDREEIATAGAARRLRRHVERTRASQRAGQPQSRLSDKVARRRRGDEDDDGDDDYNGDDDYDGDGVDAASAPWSR